MINDITYLCPDSYAASLAYTYEQLGVYLTPAQVKMLQTKAYDIDDFWDKGLKPLSEFNG